MHVLSILCTWLQYVMASAAHAVHVAGLNLCPLCGAPWVAAAAAADPLKAGDESDQSAAAVSTAAAVVDTVAADVDTVAAVKTAAAAAENAGVSTAVAAAVGTVEA